MVSSGIALVATHVIAPQLDAISSGKRTLICYGLARSGLQIWRAKTVLAVPNCDISIIGLEYAAKFPPSRAFNRASITTRLPRLGEELFVVGFRADAAHFTTAVRQLYKGRVLVAGGNVTQRYPTAEGRDRSFINFPSLELDCPSLGGMSGGPVFDMQGFLVGLLSSSFTTEDGGGPSYVSLLYPALGHRFSGGWPASFFSKPASLLDLSTGLCSIDRPGAIKVTYDDNVEQYNIAYKIWE